MVEIKCKVLTGKNVDISINIKLIYGTLLIAVFSLCLVFLVFLIRLPLLSACFRIPVLNPLNIISEPLHSSYSVNFLKCKIHIVRSEIGRYA